MMPDEDGIHYCNRLKKSGNSIPFVFLSAVGTPDSVQSGIASGASAYFIKPFDARELQQKILALAGTSLTLPTNLPKKTHRWFNR
jgi:DNA-binding response OmpR family regulator